MLLSSSAPPAEPNPPERPGRPGRLGRVFRAVALTLGACGLAAALCGYGWRFVMDPPGPWPEASAVVVPRGSGIQLAAVLASHGVIREPLLFRAVSFVTQRQGPLRAAE